MSQFSAPRRFNPVPRAPLPGVADVGYGAADMPYTQSAYSQGERDAELLEAALDSLGGAVHHGNRLAQRAAAEQEALAEEGSELLRGAGARQFNEDLPNIESDIATGKVPVPTGDVGPLVESLVRARTAALDEVAADEYSKRAIPAFTRLALARRDRANAESQAEGISVLGDAASGSTDAAAIRAKVDEARRLFPTASNEDALTIPLKAMMVAAHRGDQQAFEAAREVLGDRFADKTAIASAALRESQQRAQADTNRDFTEDIAKFRGMPAEIIRGRIGQWEGRASAQSIQRQYQELQTQGEIEIAKAQRQTEMGLRTEILVGSIGADGVATRVRAAALLSPNSPEYIDPQTGQQILNSVATKQRESLAETTVRAVLNGVPGNLTETQHGAAFSKFIGPEGFGFLDESNRITNPGSLAMTLAHARIAPAPVRSAVVASLTSTNPQDVTKAAQVLGALSVSNPGVYYDFVNDFKDQPATRNMIDAAAESFTSGRLNDPASAKQEAERIRTVGASNAQGIKPAPTIMTELRDTGVDIAAELSIAVGSAKSRYPHLTDRTFGLDWLDPDPALPELGGNVRELAENWYAQRWAQVSALPRSLRSQEARRYVSEQLARNVDFVRWGDLIQPVLIDDGQGMKLPESLRWNAVFENEARADVVALGVDPDRVATMRPYLAPATEPGADPTARMGWVFVTTDGDVLRGDGGRLAVFKPSDQARAENDRLRRQLDDRVWAFEAARMAKHRLISTAVSQNTMNYRDLPALSESPIADRTAPNSK